jgi:Xaa-Pro aminopeptidase
MNPSVFQERIGALRKALRNKSCDTAWIIQPENRRYLSGFRAEDPQLTESSGSLLINQNQCLLVTDSRYVTEAQEEAVDFKVQQLEQDLVEDLPGLVKGMGGKSVGFEEDYLAWRLYRQLDKKFKDLSPPIVLKPLDGIVEDMREVKDDLEIEKLAVSAELISVVLDEVIGHLRPGVSENEVAWQIEGLVREAGADGTAFSPIVASGPNGALPHAVPTDRKLEAGEPIIFDVGARLNGYCSDMTRTVFLGETNSEVRKIYGTVRKAQLAALKEISPGIESNHPDKIARNIIEDEGYGKYFGHALGHGVGLATHERPRLGPRKPVTLKKGMVVTVEPGIYIPGRYGVRLEEMVVIENDGPRILTKSKVFYDF